jgi:hypothetical protein
VNGEPMQQVEESVDVMLTAIDVVEDAGEGGSQGAARRGVEEFFAQFFDLEQGPLFQARLWRIAADQHVLAIAVHHIIFDATSAVIVFREIWQLYRDLARGTEPLLRAEPAQYADYLAWQSTTQAAWVETHASYWADRLAGAAPVHLPRDRETGTVSPYTWLSLKVSFGAELSAALHNLAQQHRVMMGIVILAVYAAVLGGWSNRRDLVIPYVISGRVSPAHKNIVGMLAETLPLRLELVENESFSEALNRTRQAFYAAMAHLDCGRLMVERPELQDGTPMQWSSWTPRALTGVPDASEWGESPELAFESFPFTTARPEIECDSDLGLVFINTNSGICGCGSYRGDLFRPETANWFSEELRWVAGEIVRQPDCRMHSLLRGRGA